jgi:hypothetical protein
VLFFWRDAKLVLELGNIYLSFQVVLPKHITTGFIKGSSSGKRHQGVPVMAASLRTGVEIGSNAGSIQL